MHVLVISPGYPTENSFACSFVKHQAIALKKNNVKVTVVSFIFFNKYALKNRIIEIEENENLTIYKIFYYKNFPVYNLYKNIFSTYQYIKKNVLKKDKIDVVHAHFFWPSGVIALLIKKYFKIPFVVTSHESTLQRSYKTPLHKKLIFKIFKTADAIISVGKAKLNYLEQITHREIHLVHNVVDTAFFRNPNISNSLKINGQIKIFHIGFLGMLDGNRKGLDTLLYALAEMNEKNFFLHIGGHGSNLNFYKNLVNQLKLQDKVKFYGMIKYQDVPEFYKKLDFFILPSRGENNPTVIIEAMAAGLPVISTSCGGPEFMINNENGIIVPPDNVIELKNAILEMMKNYSNYDKNKIMQYAENNYSEKVISNQLIQIYNQIISR